MTCGCAGSNGAGGGAQGRGWGVLRSGDGQVVPGGAMTVNVAVDLLAKNDGLAAATRQRLEAHGILALNLIGAPGCGKTALLESTVRACKSKMAVGVIEGDQATPADAERVRAAGCAAVQINTGTGCHLDAGMVAAALDELGPPDGGLVLIENVGNLVCPALFDLGERAKVAVLSVTEGEDKPLKYPHLFRAARLMILNKIDLLPHVRFDVARCLACVKAVNPDIEILQLSAATGMGLDAWERWLQRQMSLQRTLSA